MKTNEDRYPQGLFAGLATVDVSYTVDEIPRRNQKISVERQLITAGGPATNAAATFAFLGGQTTLVTAVGAHPVADVIREDLANLSIRLYDMARGRREPPPISSVVVHRVTGERSVVSANAAVFSPLKIEFNPRWLRGISIIQVDGQYMSLCIAAARAAKDRGIRVVLDSGSWKPGMAKLLPFVSTAICSRDFRPPHCDREEDALEFLLASGTSQVAITRGSQPIRWFERGERGEIPVRKIHAIDTLGAGDVFHGAFCYYTVLPGYTFHEALAAASRVATSACRYPGARSWMAKASR